MRILKYKFRNYYVVRRDDTSQYNTGEKYTLQTAQLLISLSEDQAPKTDELKL